MSRLFTDEKKLNRRLKEHLSKKNHLEEINGETWHVNITTGERILILDKNDNWVNEIPKD